ncbi:MAG: hypothetical protein ABSC48_08905 [Terracidiphilus sp.]
MRTGLRVARGIGLLALGAASMACAQSPAAPHRGRQALLSSGGLNAFPAAVARPAAGELAQGEILREIDDPQNGDRWLLMRNDQVPGGPGRLVLAASRERAAAPAPLRTARSAEQIRPLPVIRAGDRLTVEEHTARVDAILEARALSTVALGSALEVRLAIGGRVVWAVALGPGRAALQPWTEGRP